MYVRPVGFSNNKCLEGGLYTGGVRRGGPGKDGAGGGWLQQG